MTKMWICPILVDHGQIISVAVEQLEIIISGPCDFPSFLEFDIQCEALFLQSFYNSYNILHQWISLRRSKYKYNSPPVVVTNTDYAFIRFVDKPNGKDWFHTDKGKTSTDKLSNI